jgi:ribosomal protein S18 acetylase RimI-like enzyme
MAWRLRDDPPDAAFGLRLYAAGRARELAATGWPAAVQQAFLAQQHAAREAHYRRVHPQAEDRVIERDAQAVGRLLLARDAKHHRVVDLALLPAAQGQGIGSALLRELQRAAQHAGLRLCLQVADDNEAALRLYLRLGFVPEPSADKTSAYRALHWRAAVPQPA